MIKFTKFLFIISLLFPLGLSSNDLDEQQSMLLESLPPDQREAIRAKMTQGNKIESDLEEIFEDKSTLIERPNNDIGIESDCPECIYGYDIFRFSPSTFAPFEQAPIPSSYLLGPGDKIKISIYGSEQINFEDFIDRNGFINIPKLGTISLGGISITQAENLINNMVKKELVGAEVTISLSKLRNVTIYILGEAYKPGAYTVGSLSNVTNALFAAGGVSEMGSLRNIQVKRAGKLIVNYDFYKFLINGDVSKDIRLEDGDTIYIPFIEDTVQLRGAFKRPHIYEFLPGETISDAVKMAGGYTKNVNIDPRLEINTINYSSQKRENIYINSSEETLKRKILNGDIINVSETSSFSAGLIELSGEVKNPGTYSILDGDRILDIINRAGGFTDQSYVLGAVYTRELVAKQQKKEFLRSAEVLENSLLDIIQSGSLTNISEFTLTPISNIITKLRTQEPIGRQVVDLGLLKLKTDPYSNFIVRDGDKVFIPERPDHISVVGEVQNVISLRYSPNKSPEEYIALAGGLKQQADEDRILIISPNGESGILKRSLFSKGTDILPGSTIVVNRETRPLDYLQLTQIVTPILANLATSAAAIAAISND